MTQYAHLQQGIIGNLESKLFIKHWIQIPPYHGSSSRIASRELSRGIIAIVVIVRWLFLPGGIGRSIAFGNTPREDILPLEFRSGARMMIVVDIVFFDVSFVVFRHGQVTAAVKEGNEFQFSSKIRWQHLSQVLFPFAKNNSPQRNSYVGIRQNGHLGRQPRRRWDGRRESR